MKNLLDTNKLGWGYIGGYGLLVMAIIGPIFFSSGLIFSTDLIFGEYYKYYFYPGENLQILRPIFFVWSKFLPMHVLEKIIFVIVFASIYYGGKKLLFIFSQKKRVVFLGIIFFVFNPFFYERFVEGALNVYFSYALYPLFFYLTIKLFQDFKIKTALKTIILSVIICGISTYNIIIILPIIFIFSLFKKESWWQSFKVGLMITGGIILANAYWIIPTWQEKNIQGQMIFSSFSQEDFVAFGPVTLPPMNISTTVLTLNGHWAEKFHRFPSVMDVNKHWIGIALIIGFFIATGIGIALCQKNNKRIIGPLVLIGIVFYFLSLGTSVWISRGITNFLVENLYFYRGMRETSKFLEVVPIIYGIFLVVGTEYILDFINKKLKYRDKLVQNLSYGLFVLIIILYAQPLLGVVGKQLNVVHYPGDWYELRDFLELQNEKNKNNICRYKEVGIIKECYVALNLPWHYYQYFNFTNRVIINPLPHFFKFNILSADNIEVGNVKSHSNRKESKVVEDFIEKLKNKKIEDDVWREEMLNMGIRYIILVKEEDWKVYDDFFSKKDNLKSVFVSKNFVVYEIN